jgi:hypothetical protein
MESEPSRVDLLDGVGLTPSPDEPVQPEPEESSGPEAAVDSPESAEPTPSDERRLTPDA